ncbi:hypothetical protein BZA77DRAFT_327156 [Pyronema omphalodes]|nr:hypothetical protein BZA77DRAFT_327156 [Pyronema omphalodes]
MSKNSSQYLTLVNELAKHNHIDLDGVIPPEISDVNYVHPNDGYILLIFNLVLAITSFLVVATRFYTRTFVAGSIGGDDIMIGIALVAVIGSTALNLWAVYHAGVGKHFYDLTGPIEAERLLKYTYALPMLYSLGVVIIKSSILLYYRRLFGNNKVMQNIVTYFLIFQWVFAISSILAFATICNPIKAWWVLSLRNGGCPTLKQTMAIYVSLRLVTVLCDIGVLCLPMRMVWKLQLPLRHRIGLLGVFALGFLACSVAIARLALLPRLTLSLDASWNVLPIAILDQSEQCLGIITASIPALTALISKFLLHKKVSPTRPYPSSKAIWNGSGSSAEFDFLSFAYDPDRQNLGTYEARAYSTAAPLESGNRKGRRGMGRGREKDEDEELVLGDIGGIEKTTTVTVHVS